MKTLFSFAFIAAVIWGCGRSRSESIGKSDELAKPEFDQFVSIEVKSEDVDAYKGLISDYAKFSGSEPDQMFAMSPYMLPPLGFAIPMAIR